MPTTDKKPQPERASTDEGLRSEREKSDIEYATAQTSIEAGADTAIQQARESTDELLQATRENADVRLSRSGTSAQARESVERERVHEDTALQAERATADAERRDERAESRRALAILLHLERAETDSRLLLERTRADEGLATRDQFMGMVSHDLRTLLGGIALQAALLKRNAAEDEVGSRSVQAAEKIQRFTARMNRLIGDLVDVASMEEGRIRVTPALQDATALVRESVEAFQPLASSPAADSWSWVFSSSPWGRRAPMVAAMESSASRIAAKVVIGSCPILQVADHPGGTVGPGPRPSG